MGLLFLEYCRILYFIHRLEFFRKIYKERQNE